ncbi:MAG TPA: hypothetical protein VGR90_06650 [Acidimicrobiales bacterium]|nr:hypothetical protein [Acidimicrobiales bacterium]
MRSWFRIGLRLGLLAGVAFAIVVTMRSRRAEDSGSRAVGVHGDWPDVPRAPAAQDHHPHGRVTVPMEAAPLGAPPAVETTTPGPAEPEVPLPAEHLDAETTGAPAAGAAGAKKAAKKAAAPVKKAAKKAAAPVKKAAKKAAAPVKKAAKKAAAPVRKADPKAAPPRSAEPPGPSPEAGPDGQAGAPPAP